MISDPSALAEAKLNWAGVETLQDKLQRSAFASQGHGGGSFPFALADAAHNLPLIHAFSVLNDVLEQLSFEGRFVCKSRFLGALIESSEKVLPWQDIVAIKAGVKDRNEIAHKGSLLTRGVCWQHIEAIKTELHAWGVI